MTTNKPNVEAYLVTRIKGQGYGKPRRVIDAEDYDVTLDSFFAKGAKENYTVEPLIPLSAYEALQAENETLHRDMSTQVEALEELIDLMEDIRQGEYTPDSFTTQPARIALAAYRKQVGEP